jgi:tetratricopeptide (TPR) repeat protein
MINRRILVFFTISISFLVNAQNQKAIDSLETLLKTQEGKARLKTLHEISFEYLFYDTKLALPYITEEEELAKKLNDSSFMAESANIHGVLYNLNSEYRKAIKKYNEAKSIFMKLSNNDRLSRVLNNIAICYNDLGEYEKSLQTHMEALKVKEEINADLDNLAASYWNIGNAQGDINNFEASNEWYRKAIKAYEELNQEDDLISVQTLIGYNYKSIKEYDKALPYFIKAIAYYKKTNQDTNLAGIYDVTGNLYFELNDYEQAKNYYEKSIEVSKDHNEVTLTAKSIRNLGRVYHKQNDNKKALELLFKSLSTFEEREAKQSIYNNYHYIADVYESMQNYEQAYTYHKKYSTLYHDVMNNEKLDAINELEIKYQTEKKEAEIALQEEEIKTLNTQSENDRLIKTLYGIGMFSFLTIAGLLYFGFKQRIKKNKIERQKQEEIYKQEIEFKKKELASQTLHLVQKSTFIQELKENLEKIKSSPELFKVEFRRLVMLLKKESAEDKDWEVFKSYFSEVHNNFDLKIKEIASDISEKEIRLASFLRMNLSTKEIASMLNVLPDSVLKSKYRLKKKLGLNKDEDLTQFLNTF